MYGKVKHFLGELDLYHHSRTRKSDVRLAENISFVININYLAF
jgi:hypothetical protein